MKTNEYLYNNILYSTEQSNKTIHENNRLLLKLRKNSLKNIDELNLINNQIESNKIQIALGQGVLAHLDIKFILNLEDEIEPSLEEQE